MNTKAESPDDNKTEKQANTARTPTVQKGKLQFDILSFLERAKKIIIASISLIALILVLYYLISSSVDKKMSITPFSVPKVISDMGYTDITCSKMYLDEIKIVSATAKTIYVRKDYKTYEEELDINVPFIEKEISIGTAKSFIQRVFNIKTNSLIGDISIMNNDSIILTTRYNKELPVVVKGKLSDLKNIFRQSVEEQFKNFDPYLLASYLNSSDKDIESVEAIKYTLSKEPNEDDKWAYNLWGTILMKYEYYDEARVKLEKSKSLDTTFFLPYYNFGQLSFIDSNYTEAIKYYRRSIALNKNFDRSYIRLSAAYLAQQDLPNANMAIDTAIQLNPKNGDCYIQKAQILLHQKDTNQAIAEIDKAIEMNSKEPSYFLLLANIKLMQNKTESAQQLISRAYHMDTTDFKVAGLFRASMIANGDTAMANSFKERIDRLIIDEFAKIMVRHWTKEKLIH